MPNLFVNVLLNVFSRFKLLVCTNIDAMFKCIVRSISLSQKKVNFLNACATVLYGKNNSMSIHLNSSVCVHLFQ